MCHLVGFDESTFYSGYDASVQAPGVVECVQVPEPSILDALIHNGKSLLEVAEWIRKFDPF